jgi:hypothetical protein
MQEIRREERGEGRFGSFVALMVLLIAIYAGVKVVPVMVNSYAFRDFLEGEARFAALRKHDDEVKNRILRKAQELDLPIGPKEIIVNRTNVYFDVRVQYTVPIVTPVHTFNWDFDESIRAPLF